MSPILRNILAVIAGIVIGGIVNSSIISLGPHVISAPEGVNPNDIESIKSNVHLYGAKHFIVPFIAHAFGTLAGVFIMMKIAVSNHRTLALIIGGVFFFGGVMMAYILPEFWMFSIVDLLFAYFPVAILGWMAAGKGENHTIK